MRQQVISCAPILAFGSLRRKPVNTVVLVHQSARDYLLRSTIDVNDTLENFRVKHGPAHAYMAGRCVAYLDGGVLQDRPVDSKQLYDQVEKEGGYKGYEPDVHSSTGAATECPSELGNVITLDREPFLSYAAFNLTTHAKFDSQSALSLCEYHPGFFAKQSRSRQNWHKTFDCYPLRYGRPFIGGTDVEASSPLEMACCEELIHWARHIIANPIHLEAYEQFLHQDLASEETAEAGGMPLFFAVYRHNVDMVRLLCSNGFYSSHTKVGSFSPLCQTAAAGGLPYGWKASQDDVEIIRLLLTAGASLNSADDEGYTPLMTAVSNCQRYSWVSPSPMVRIHTQ